jgi:ribokinase
MTVVVVGDVAADVIVVLAEPIAPGSDARATNRLLGGGAGANVAAWLAAEGVATTLCGRIGDDLVGRQQADLLAAAGITTRLAVDARRATGMVVALVGPEGERTMFPDRGANAALAPEDVLPALGGARHLHVSGYVLLDDGSREAGLSALAQARAGGSSTSVDLSSAAPLRAAGPRRVLDWTQDVDLCKGNTTEAGVLVGGATAEERCARLGERYRCAVVTAGAQGAWIAADGAAPIRVPAKAAAIVDSVGAGDAFTAGFLAAWTAGADAASAGARGAAAAARAVATRGGRPS